MTDKAPERIWATESEKSQRRTWSFFQINDSRVEYIRADIAEAERDAARAERDNLQAELIGVLNRETVSLARWEDKLAAARAELARVTALVVRAQKIIDPCYPPRCNAWQIDARAALPDAAEKGE